MLDGHSVRSARRVGAACPTTGPNPSRRGDWGKDELCGGFGLAGDWQNGRTRPVGTANQLLEGR
jgi:hypothetical protein